MLQKEHYSRGQTDQSLRLEILKTPLHLVCLLNKSENNYSFFVFFSLWNIYNFTIYDSNTCLLLNNLTSDKSEDLSVTGFKTCRGNFADPLDKELNISNFFNIAIAENSLLITS